MKDALRYLFPIALLVLVTGLFLVVFKEAIPAGEYKQNMFEAGAGVATALLVITLFVERSMAVINSLLFGDVQREAELKRMSESPEVKLAGEKEYSKVMTSKERLRLLIAFAAGLFISAAGVRTLAGLMTITADGPTGQLVFAVDVILTAGVIAGGSNSLQFLIQLLKDLATRKEGDANPQFRAQMATTS